jgi:bisphosphoglycerate-independent phosphoglycerate mutase (AlkP superfamily)
MLRSKPLTLIILDGWGYRAETNAIAPADCDLPLSE